LKVNIRPTGIKLDCDVPKTIPINEMTILKIYIKNQTTKPIQLKFINIPQFQHGIKVHGLSIEVYL